MTYGSYGSDGDGCKGPLKVILVLAVILLVLGYCTSAVSNWIGTDEALERFQELAGTNDVEIIRCSNSSPIFGDPNDVTCELMVEGQRKSGRCTSGDLSQMVCRVYGEGEGD